MYGTFAYNLVRSDFTKLISLFGGLFILSYQLIKMYGWNFKLLLGLGIFFRIIFLFATPNLSQDFYRFIWDGQVLMQGFSPYLVSPVFCFGYIFWWKKHYWIGHWIKNHYHPCRYWDSLLRKKNT